MSPTEGSVPGPTSRCPWCSAEVPTGTLDCPACGAILQERAGGEVPGVTAIDQSVRTPRLKSRPKGLAKWLAGEAEPESPSPIGEGRVEPVSREVRREMMRMELDALQAELQARLAEAAADRETSSEGDPPGEGLVADH
jgi:hypothetical protein